MNRLVFLAIVCASSAQAQTVLVKPYVQPGDGSTLSGTDVKVLTWITDQKPGDFTVEYSIAGGPMHKAEPARTALDFAKYIPKAKAKPAAPDASKKEPAGAAAPAKPATPAPAQPAAPKAPAPAAPAKETPKPADSSKARSVLEDAATTLDELKEKVVETFKPIEEREQHYFRYRAVLPELPFDSEVSYRVSLGGKLVREGKVKTRASAAKPIRFIAVGDMASNRPEQYAIAYRASLEKPDFFIALGDIVYPGGRALQYMNHFWPCYNDVEKPGPKTGAPIAATVPIYPVIGNHDADMQRLPDYADAYSAFYFFSVPKNGPGTGSWNVPLGKDATLAAAFKAGAGEEYPAMSHYSFDYGPAHILVLDANSYSLKEIDKVSAWIEKDLSSTRQRWKFVCFHQPAFHTSREHYSEQRMRLLQPVFEKCGVDVIFAGHVHNYQRSKPFKFVPNPPKRDSRGRVNGDYTFDNTFDGVKDTTPEGVIHVVTGGGGAKLYGGSFEKTVEYLKKEHTQNYVPLTAKYVADKNSYSVIDLTPAAFELRQVTLEGVEVDRFRITKP